MRFQQFASKSFHSGNYMATATAASTAMAIENASITTSRSPGPLCTAFCRSLSHFDRPIVFPHRRHEKTFRLIPYGLTTPPAKHRGHSLISCFGFMACVEWKSQPSRFSGDNSAWSSHLALQTATGNHYDAADTTQRAPCRIEDEIPPCPRFASQGGICHKRILVSPFRLLLVPQVPREQGTGNGNQHFGRGGR